MSFSNDARNQLRPRHPVCFYGSLTPPRTNAAPSITLAVLAAACRVTDGGAVGSGLGHWACLLDDHLVMQAGQSARHVYIGVAANRGTAQVLEQIERARAQRAQGLSIYSYSSVTPDMWSALSAGPSPLPPPCHPAVASVTARNTISYERNTTAQRGCTEAHPSFVTP